MCDLCGNPACQGSEKLVETLMELKDSDLALLLTDKVTELRKALGPDHPAAQTAAVVQVLMDELLVRFTEFAIRNAFGFTSPVGRSSPRPVLYTSALLGGVLGAGIGGAFQRDVTPRRGARSKGPKEKPVMRRFRPPRTKDS